MLRVVIACRRTEMSSLANRAIAACRRSRAPYRRHQETRSRSKLAMRLRGNVASPPHGTIYQTNGGDQPSGHRARGDSASSCSASPGDVMPTIQRSSNALEGRRFTALILRMAAAVRVRRGIVCVSG
jgi:hypothetical protein